MTLEGEIIPNPEDENIPETEEEETGAAEPEEGAETDTEPEAEEKTEPETVTGTALATTSEVKTSETPAAEPAPKKLSNEIKIVIVMKDTNILLGVQSPDCDPVYDTATGDLAAALQLVPAIVAKAKEKWTANPRYPKANIPAPPPPPPRASSSASSKSTKSKTEEDKAQPSFF